MAQRSIILAVLALLAVVSAVSLDRRIHAVAASFLVPVLTIAQHEAHKALTETHAHAHAHMRDQIPSQAAFCRTCDTSQDPVTCLIQLLTTILPNAVCSLRFAFAVFICVSLLLFLSLLVLQGQYYPVSDVGLNNDYSGKGTSCGDFTGIVLHTWGTSSNDAYFMVCLVRFVLLCYVFLCWFVCSFACPFSPSC